MTWNDIPRDPSRSTLRQFAGLCVVVFGALAAFNASRGHSVWAAGYAAASALGGIGLAAPAVMRPLFVGWLMLVFPVGWVVSRVLLTAIYLGLFTPLGLSFRLVGRDALKRQRPVGDSFWVKRPAPAAAAQYYRQF